MKRKRWVIYKSGPSNLAMFFAGAAIISWIGFLLASGFPLVQWIYYRFSPSTSYKLSEILQRTAKGADSQVIAKDEVEPFELPGLDMSLPQGYFVNIPKMGVDSEIYEATLDNYESALRRGVWRVPDFSIPSETYKKPIILVAHRFGYLEWSNLYRRQHSFFNIDKLEVGDEVKVIWEQRKYVYRIERIAEGEEIDSYNYDLILYTCKFLVSPVKIFAYGMKVN